MCHKINFIWAIIISMHCISLYLINNVIPFNKEKKRNSVCNYLYFLTKTCTIWKKNKQKNCMLYISHMLCLILHYIFTLLNIFTIWDYLVTFFFFFLIPMFSVKNWKRLSSTNIFTSIFYIKLFFILLPN